MPTIIGTPGIDILPGTPENDIINGLGGNDTLSGAAGNDKLDGGADKDELDGGAHNDTLIGGDGDDTLIGRSGNNVLKGGKGDDVYFVESSGDKLTEAPGQGNDTVVVSGLASFALGANFETLVLTTAASGLGNTSTNVMVGSASGDKLDGAGGNDRLIGDEGDDTLIGGAGNDSLEGDIGADKMTGGAGNDVYFVDDPGDTVTELAGGGIDLVKATIDGLILGANVEHLTLLGGAGLSGTGNDLANALTGNGGVNLLTGGKGNDTLDGGGGADNLNGGAGNDTYLVDKSTDVVLEDAGGGSKDTVLSADDFQLQVGQEIEVLIFTSDADIVGLGNSFGNTIAMTGAGKANLGGAGGNDILTGAANDDTLDGGGADDFLKGGGGKDLLIGAGGNDKLEGGEGNDTLEGGTGIDILAGGKGDDSYLVDETGDKIVELPNQGFDAVRSLAAVYTLGANAEDLVLLTGALIGTGNATGNTITGNGVSNKLDGAGGNDTLLGKEGIDVLLGGAGNDTLDGGVAADTMTGGAGNDLYLVDSTSDVVMEAAGGGTDHVRSVIGGLFLGANVENLTYLGSGNFVGFGNALANVLVGNDGKNSLFGDKGNDTLDGALGNDTLEGGAGNDTYFVDSFDDVVRDLPAAGKDTVHSTTTYQLASDQEIEVLTLSSAGFVVGGGNNFANVITMKGSGESFLIGNGGKDALTGGDGNDTLSGGIDNDTLKGGNGDDTLEGEGGNDSMSGGKGDDHYTIESIGDRVTELPGQGIDTVFSWLGSYTLGANIENLTLNSGGFGGKGNALGNIILGNDFFGNPLDGGGGDDTISGAGGGDTLLGGLGNDSLDGGLGSDMLKGGAGLDVLDGGLGADTMLGELGQDYFVYRLAATTDLPSLGGDTINGFQTGTDRIELTDLLTDFGIDAATAFDGGFVLLTKSGADTLVQFDKDGISGASGALTLATVTKAGVAESDVLLDGFAGA